MPRPFDALHEWLGIPAAEQPPDYYRLLGLPPFEPDAAVIADAAQKRIARVEELGAVNRAAHARALVEQLRAAERCLKTPQTKAAYDRSLRERQSVQAATAGRAATPLRWRRWLVGLACGAAAAIVIGLLASRAGRKSEGVGVAQHRAAAPATGLNPKRQGAGKPAVEAASGGQPSAENPEAPRVVRVEPKPEAEPADHRRVESGETGKQAPAGATAAVGRGAEQSAVAAPPAETRNAAPPAPTVPPAEATKNAPPPAASPAADTSAQSWLRLDEHGEPCEATLADGTVLKLDTYGETYEAWRVAPPVNGEHAEAVVDYQRDRLGSNWGCFALQLDVAGARMYWVELGPTWNAGIRSAGLDGHALARPLDLRLQKPFALAIDATRRRLYWSSNANQAAFGEGPEARRAVWRAALNGSNPDALFAALTAPGAIAVEPTSGTVYYFDDLRLMRGGADGSNEAVVIERLVFGHNESHKGLRAAIDAKGGKIYWSNHAEIARANLDGTEFEVVLSDGGFVGAIALDIPKQKVYWTAVQLGELWRANLDGSQRELFALAMRQPSGLDLDLEHGYVYWTDSKIVGIESYGLVRRLRIPPLPVKESKPAPPLVSSMHPPSQRAGGKVEVRGAHLSQVEHVRVVGDDGRQADTRFTRGDDGKLTFVLPARREGVKRVAVVVEGPGGVTVTLPRNTHVARRGGAPFAKFDRAKDAGKFSFVVNEGAEFVKVEHSLVYVPAGAMVTTNGRGNVVLFLKDASRNPAADASGIIVYHEPFARITSRAKKQGDHQYIPVPAIRPSFVETLLTYQAEGEE